MPVKYTTFHEEDFDDFNDFIEKLCNGEHDDFEEQYIQRIAPKLKLLLENVKEYQNARLKRNTCSQNSKNVEKNETESSKQPQTQPQTQPQSSTPQLVKEVAVHNINHNEEIDRIIQNIKRKPGSYKVNVINTSHEDFVKGHSHGLFTNIIQKSFTKKYLKNHPCACGNPSVERCHGLRSNNEDRQSLIRKALARVWPDTSKQIMTLDIVVAFLEEHKDTGFTFKCHSCHQKYD